MAVALSKLFGSSPWEFLLHLCVILTMSTLWISTYLSVAIIYFHWDVIAVYLLHSLPRK